MIRAALGANARPIIVAVLCRGMGQTALGILLGAGLISLTVAESPEGIRLVAGGAAAMVVVGLLGCLIPAVRALRAE